MLLSVILGQAGCSKQEIPELVTTTQTDLLGTAISISLYQDAKEIREVCMEKVADIDKRMSANLENNEIAQINNSEGKPVEVEKDVYQLLEIAKEVSEKSDGGFDVTIGALTTLWKKDGIFSILPEEEAILKGKELVHYQDLDLQDGKVTLKKGMKLDFGGIAKGYACDQVVNILKENQINSGLLDFGGNIYALGKKEDNSKWKVGIKTPETGAGDLLCAVEVEDKSVVTSGVYERNFIQDGVTYHHLLDPKTGYPSESDLKSVTVIAESSTLADCLTTAIYVLGLEKGKELLKEYPQVEGIFVTKENEVFLSEGIGDGIQLMNEDYRIVK